MARTPLSKDTTYATMTTNVRNEARMTTTGFSLLTDAYVHSLILFVVHRFALILNANNKPFYRAKENLTLIGDESPYYVDCTGLSPYWNNSVRLTHVTSGGTRTPITVLDPNRAEDFAKLATIQANTILALQLGWGFRLFFGSGITVTKSTDVVEFMYDSQPLPNSSGASGATYIDTPDELIPFVKDEVVEYLMKYKGTMPYDAFQKSKIDRIQMLSTK